MGTVIVLLYVSGNSQIIPIWSKLSLCITVYVITWVLLLFRLGTDSCSHLQVLLYTNFILLLPFLQDLSASLCFRGQRIFLHNASGCFGNVPLEASGDFGINPEEGEFHLMCQVLSLQRRL